MAQQWNTKTSHGGTVEHVVVESGTSGDGTEKQRWWNSGTSQGGPVQHLMQEQWNRDSGTF